MNYITEAVSDQWPIFMQQVGYPFLSALLLGLVTLGVNYMRQRTALQGDQTKATQEMAANNAIQNAITNQVGKFLVAVQLGKISMDDVLHARMTPEIIAYLQQNVAESMGIFQLTPQSVADMIVGKIGQALKVSSTATVNVVAAPGADKQDIKDAVVEAIKDATGGIPSVIPNLAAVAGFPGLSPNLPRV